MKPTIIVMDEHAAESVDRLATFTAKITQASLGQRTVNDYVNMLYKGVEKNSALIDKLIEADHNQCFRMNMVPVLVIGCSRRFLAQITRHHVGVEFMSASLQYAAWCDDYKCFLDENPEFKKYYDQIMEIYKDVYSKTKDKDMAGYFAPQGLQGVLVISATPWEWRHMFQVRLCKRNTPETIEIMSEIQKKLVKYSNVFKVGPMCSEGSCKEFFKCRGDQER